MVSSPEEYFNTQDFSPTSSQAEYTAAEKLFMQKYLGMNENELLGGYLKAKPSQRTPPARQDSIFDYIGNMSFETAEAHAQQVEAPAFIEKATLPNTVRDESEVQETLAEERPFDTTIEGDGEVEAVEATPRPEDSKEAVSEDLSDKDSNQVEATELVVLETEKAQLTTTPLAPEAVVETTLESAPEPESMPEIAATAPEESETALPEEAASKAALDPNQVEATEIVSLETEEPELTTPPLAPEAAVETTLESAPKPESMPEIAATAPEESKIATAKEIATAPPAPVAEKPVVDARTEYERIKEAEIPLETVLKEEVRCQMVAFFIGTQEFIIPTMAMQEVLRFEQPIRIPLAPPFVEGVITLRGRVTPVVNLRDMLEVTNKPRDDGKCIIICLRRGIQLGFVVEKIHTMYWVPQKDLEWSVEAQLGINPDVDFISAVMKSEDGSRLLGMISVDKIIDFILC